MLSRKGGHIVCISAEKEIMQSRKVLLFLELQFLTCIKQWSYSVICLISVSFKPLRCIRSFTLGFT